MSKSFEFEIPKIFDLSAPFAYRMKKMYRMNQIIESLRNQDKIRFAAFRRSNIQARALSEFVTHSLVNKYIIRESNEVCRLSKYVSTKADASISSAVQIATKTFIQRIIKLAKEIQRSTPANTEIPLSPQNILSAFQAITLPPFVVASENRGVDDNTKA